MPVVGGKVVRSRFTSLSLKELSSVDNPAQPGAVATILKRAEPDSLPAPTGKASWLARAIAKYVDEDDGAHTFQEVLSANDFDEKIWPMVSALSQSIRSIMGDAALKAAEKQTKVQASVDQFLAAMRELDPPTNDSSADTPAETVEKAFRAILATTPTKKGADMPKTVAELIAENPALKAHMDTIEGERDTAKRALETEQAAHVTTKAALVTATEETLKVGDHEVKKSIVGEASFSIFKAQEERAQLATMEKRAETEFGHLTGTATEKAKVLKAVESNPDEETRKAALAILTSAEKMAAAGFDRLGSGGGNETPTQKAAQTTFTEKVADIKKNNPGIAEHEAMSKARREHPDLFRDAYGEDA